MHLHKKDSNNPTAYYRKSGIWSFQAIPVFLFIGVSLAAFWGYLHALALVYSPGFFANAFYVLLFAILMARIDSLMVIHYGKIRNEKVAKIFGYFSVACFFYLHYTFWIDLGLRNHPDLQNTELAKTYINEFKEQLIPAIIFTPERLLSYIVEINKVGLWGFGSTNISGIPLIVFWGSELMLFSMTVPFNYKDRTNRPFCEMTNEWFQYDDLFPTTFIFHQNEFIQKLEKADYSILDGLKRVKSTVEHSQIRLFFSKNTEYYLSAVNKQPKPNNHDENLSYKEMEVVKLIRIDKVSGKKLTKLIRDSGGD